MRIVRRFPAANPFGTNAKIRSRRIFLSTACARIVELRAFLRWLLVGLSLFYLTVAIGYNVGKDLAKRDNAKEAATQAAQALTVKLPNANGLVC